MKKNKIIVVILLLFIIIFIVYKSYMLHVYKTEHVKLDNSVIFKERIDINEPYENTEIINFDDMTYNNFFVDYKENENGFNVKYDDNNEVASYYRIVKDKQYINVLSMNSYQLFSEEENNNTNFETEENMKDLLNKNNIKDDVDLLNYIKNNYYFKSNIFTCSKTMRNNYILNSFISVALPEFKSITLIDGNIRGYIINNTSTANIKEIHILHNDDQYIITLLGEEITSEEFVKDLIKSIRFN